MKRRNTIQTRDPAPMNRDPAPRKVVHIQQKRCPKCGGISFRVNGSHMRNGIRTQHCICWNCGYNFPVMIH